MKSLTLDFGYDFSEIGSFFCQGDEALYSANYRQIIQNESIGELTLFRHHNFSSEEIWDLEEFYVP
jgi:hypothetical protein